MESFVGSELSLRRINQCPEKNLLPLNISQKYSDKK